MENTAKISSFINKNTKLLWAETPTNPMLNIVDIKALSEIARANNILFAVDNTFATPYIQTPLDLELIL